MFDRLEFRLLRGNSREVEEFLKKGDAELGIAAEIDEEWDRLDTWPLFTEDFQLIVNRRHRWPTATRCVRGPSFEPLLSRNYCEHADALARRCGNTASTRTQPRISSEHDLIELLEADIGVAIVPQYFVLPGP